MKKYIVLLAASAVFVICFAIYQQITLNDDNLHIVFCDVGQGDAIFIRTPSNKRILVDGGPDKSVLDCLSKRMPFWDRTIDVVILTHPHQDHFFGLNYVVERYVVTHFVTIKLLNDTVSWNEFEKLLDRKEIVPRYVYKGDRLVMDDVILHIEAPTKTDLLRSGRSGVIDESSEPVSLIMSAKYKNFDVLLTGDSQADEVRRASGKKTGSIEVLHVPHHGSGTGLTTDIVKKISPMLAVISVGASNKYGHPNEKILKMLDGAGVRVLRTDEYGDVEIVSEGESWWVVKN